MARRMGRIYEWCATSYIRLADVGQKLRRLGRDEEGQGLVEYGLIIALVAIALIGAVFLLSGELGKIFGSITTGLQNPGGSTTSGG